MYSGSRVSRARCYEMSGFISYSGGVPDFCRPYKNKPQNGFVWWKALVYGGLERPKPPLHTDLEIQNLKNIFLTKDLIMIEIL